MGHWKFGPLLDSTSSSSSSCFHSEFPFSCYKAMTDPAKKALTIARTARNENFESFNFRPKVGCILHRLYRHRRFHMILFKNSPPSFHQLDYIAMLVQQMVCTQPSGPPYYPLHSFSCNFFIILAESLREDAQIFIFQKPKKIFRKSCSRNGPKPGRKAVYPPICVCTFRRFHNGLKRISAYSILFSASVDLTLFDTWDPSLKRDKSATATTHIKND